MMDEDNFSPFVGLRSFEVDEEYLFFGREKQVDDLVRNLQKTRFLAVLGASGSGKSSLVRCGLIPALFKGYMSGVGSKWRVAVFRPGNDPIGNMSRALMHEDVFGGQDPDKTQRLCTFLETTLMRGSMGLIEAAQQNGLGPRENLVLVVDQFEEIYRFKRNKENSNAYDLSKAFVKLLLQANKQRDLNIFVCLTMRSDYLGACTEFNGLPEAINSSQYLIPRLTRDQLKTVITGPVAVGGATIAPRLVTTLLNTIGDNPDQLPVLQHALMRTWDFWSENHENEEPIDLVHYEAIGTMKQALSNHADEAFMELDSERLKSCAERIFQVLTEKGIDSRGIRRPSTVKEICDGAGVSAEEVVLVANSFRQAGRCFLMPSAEARLEPETMLDISHESLMRVWGRLKGWVDEEAESAALYKHLATDAQRHLKGERGLWRDPELAQALAWYKENHPSQGWATRYHAQFDKALAFLEQANDAKVREQAAEELLRRKERARALRVVSLTAFALLTALVFVAFLLLNHKIIEFGDDMDTLEDRYEQVVRSNEEKYRQNLEEIQAANKTRRRKPIKRMLALGPKLKDPDLSALLAVQAWRYQVVDPDPAFDLPIQAQLAASLNQRKKAYDQPRHKLEKEANVLTLGSNDLLVFGFNSGKVSIRGSDNKEFQVETGLPVSALILSRNDFHLAVANKKRIEVWDINSIKKHGEQKDYPRKLRPLAVSHDKSKTMTFSLWDDILAYATNEGVFLWRYTIKDAMPTITIQDRRVTRIAIGPNLLAVAVRGKIILREMAKPSKRFHQWPTKESVSALTFSENGRYLAAGGSRGAVLVWDTTQLAQEPRHFKGHDKTVHALAFKSEDEQQTYTLASGGDDKTIRIWDKAGTNATLIGHSLPIHFLAYRNGEQTLYSGDNNTVYTWSNGYLSECLCQSVKTRFGPKLWRDLFGDLDFEGPCNDE